jgi:hypothetical protein
MLALAVLAAGIGYLAAGRQAALARPVAGSLRNGYSWSFLGVTSRGPPGAPALTPRWPVAP